MKHLVAATLAVLAVLIAAPAADAGKKSIKIKRPVPVETGLRWTFTESMKTDITVTMSGSQPMPFQTVMETEAQIEILAADDDRIDRLQITYGKLPDADQRSNLPYLIEAGSSGPVVTGADGRTLSTEEVQQVMKGHGDLVRRTPGRWMVGKTFKKGKKVKLSEAEIAEMFGNEDELRTATMTLTFVKASKTVATFRFEGTFDVTEPGVQGEMKASATGTVELDLRRGLPLSLDVAMNLAGTFSNGGKDTYAMSGTMTGTRRWTYVDP